MFLCVSNNNNKDENKFIGNISLRSPKMSLISMTSELMRQHSKLKEKGCDIIKVIILLLFIISHVTIIIIIIIY